MKFTKLAIAVAIIGVLIASDAVAQRLRQPIRVRSTAFADDSLNDSYSDYYGQPQEASPSPSDEPAPLVAGVGNLGDCDACDEANGEDEPWSLFCEGPCGLKIGGWIEAGAMPNASNVPSRFNGPLTFADRDEVQLNQLWTYMEKAIETGNYCWDVGGRVDFLFGTDTRFTQAAGLELRQDGSPRWSNERFYQLAMPQLYAEFGYNDLSVKVGHFFTIIGYEVVPAIGNFFYTHAYTMQYGEPFTHTGVLGSWKYSDRWTFFGGIHNGWDNFDDVNDRGSFLGGATLTSYDGSESLAFAITAGDERAAFASANEGRVYDGTSFSPRTMYSLVYSNQLNDCFTYVLQHDYGNQDDGVAAGSAAQPTREDAEWYGINQYLFYTINDCWKAGMRIEWFRDDDGVRVTGLGNGNPIAGDSYEGDFYEISLGLNWTPTANLRVRPEIRWDWYDGRPSGGNLPYGDGTDDDMFVGGFDVIMLF